MLHEGYLTDKPFYRALRTTADHNLAGANTRFKISFMYS